jgi:hypothetical protein
LSGCWPVVDEEVNIEDGVVSWGGQVGEITVLSMEKWENEDEVTMVRGGS